MEIIMYYIGIDIGGTSVKAGIVDECGNIKIKKSHPTVSADGVVKLLQKMTKELFSESGITLSQITAVGMGIPGLIDEKSGVVKYANNLAIDNLAIVDEYRKEINLPTYIANDADAAALGEAEFGSGRGMKNIIFVTLGTGVGTGITTSGHLLAGCEGGHIVIEMNGRPCTCGNRGCWECYASATALKKMTLEEAEKHPESLLASIVRESGNASAKTPFDAARGGDAVGAELVERYLSYVAEGIVSLANIFSPECVLIGGGVSNEEPKYFKIVEDKVNQKIYASSHKPRLIVRPASLKNDAGILGAAALALSASK